MKDSVNMPLITMNQHDAFLQPKKIGNQLVKNRIIMASMGIEYMEIPDVP